MTESICPPKVETFGGIQADSIVTSASNGRPRESLFGSAVESSPRARIIRTQTRHFSGFWRSGWVRSHQVCGEARHDFAIKTKRICRVRYSMNALSTKRSVDYPTRRAQVTCLGEKIFRVELSQAVAPTP